MGLVDFLTFLKKDALDAVVCVCVLIFHFDVLLLLLSDNVQVKYRSKVVKYIWPMPHQAQSIPWVQIQLANGDTLQTKLLVSWILSYTYTPLPNCSFFHYRTLLSVLFWGFFLSVIFFSLISSDWCRWAQLDGAKRLGNTHGEVEL